MMMVESGSKLPARIIKATFDLAATQGWHLTSFSNIADYAEISIEELYQHFPTKSAILAEFSRALNQAVLKAEPLDLSESAHDRLFNVMMHRFDALNHYRSGIAALTRDLPSNLGMLLTGTPQLSQSMQWMLEAAHIPTFGMLGLIRIHVLCIIYLLVMRVWLNDSSPDLSKTMKALDQNLAQAERFAKVFYRLFRFSPESPII
jgi:AcrR family transcriptional regulator